MKISEAITGWLSLVLNECVKPGPTPKADFFALACFGLTFGRLLSARSAVRLYTGETRIRTDKR
jgi:hypothetical protein